MYRHRPRKIRKCLLSEFVFQNLLGKLLLMTVSFHQLTIHFWAKFQLMKAGRYIIKMGRLYITIFPHFSAMYNQEKLSAMC